jgi:hypothetical protein
VRDVFELGFEYGCKTLMGSVAGGNPPPPGVNEYHPLVVAG